MAVWASGNLSITSRPMSICRRTIPTAWMSRWRVYNREDSFWTSLESLFRDKMSIQSQGLNERVIERYHASGTWNSSGITGVCGPKELDLLRSRSRVWYATLPSLITFCCPTFSLGASPTHRVLMPIGNDHQHVWVHNVNDREAGYLCEPSRLCESHSGLSRSDRGNPKITIGGKKSTRKN